MDCSILFANALTVISCIIPGYNYIEKYSDVTENIEESKGARPLYATRKEFRHITKNDLLTSIKTINTNNKCP